MACEKVRIGSEAEARLHLQPVVLGADIFGYTLVREFNRVYGLRSIVLATADVKFTSSSRFCDYRIVEGIDQEDVLVDYLLELGEELARTGRLGIVIGAGDWYARILSQHKPELERWLCVPYIDFGLLDLITQKEAFYQACEELGMDYPAPWYLPCDEPDPSFDPHAFPYPLIAKPSNSAKWHYAEFEGKKKVFEVEGPDELARIYEGACGSCYDAKLVIQDFIPGADAGLHSVTTYSDAEGNLVMSCMGQVVLQDHAPSAIGNPVLICDKRVEHVLEQAARFLKRFGYRGFANFDVKYDPRDGSYRFFEVNTRAGRNTFYVTLAGVDFVRLYVRDFAIGETLERHDATKPFCYSVVPRKVVERTVDDPELRERVLGMYDSGLAQSPLSYQPDTLAHRLWSEVNLRHQVQKFKKYVWDTGGRQAASD